MTAEEKASGRVRQLLKAYEAPEIDPALDEALLDYIRRRKTEIPPANE
jgi:trimethylamine--corrinoid protein Co-methyltransferase